MKERTQKSNTFFGGAAILAVSIAIVKIIEMCIRDRYVLGRAICTVLPFQHIGLVE